MNNTEQTASAQESTEPEDSILTKEVIQKKKERFSQGVKTAIFISIGFLIFFSLLFIFITIYNRTKDTYVVSTTDPENIGQEIVIINPEEKQPKEEWEKYGNEKFRFSFNYPPGDRFFLDEEIREDYFVKIIADDTIPHENTTGRNLIKGYIFVINPLQIAIRDIDSVVSLKREWYVEQCDQSANVTGIKSVVLNEVEGKGFEVFNCNSDYRVAYYAANDLVYEVTQVYKGDIGFEQLYKTTVGLINDSVLINITPPDTGPYTLFENVREGFSFEYDKTMDNECCFVPSPPDRTAKINITLSEGSNLAAIGFFTIRSDPAKTLLEYLEEKKQILIDDYKVIKGHEPNGTVTEFKLGGQKAYYLSGYSWKGNDLIYTTLPKSNSYLIISKTNLSDENYQAIVNSLKILTR